MMKSLSTKKIVIAMLAVLFAFSLMFAGLTANKASANTDLEEITLSTTMESSAQMRLTNPTGMRFIINVDEADFDLFGEDVKVVTMITQKNLLDAKGISVEEFDKDTDVKKAEVVFGASHFQAAKDVYGEIKLTATILEISDKNIVKDYVAKTYITDGEKIGYVEQATVASIFEVATYWKEQGLGAEDETTQAILDRYTKCDHVEYVNGACAACGTKCAHDWDGADCTICDMTREPSVAETTYGADYVAIVDGKVAIDASAINETVDLASVTAVAINGANAEFVIDGNNIVVSTSVYGEGVKFAITVANAEEYKTVTFETIVATNVLSTSDAFVAYLKANHSNTLAVLTANVSAPSGEFYQIPKGSNFSIIGVGETKPVVSGWIESVGMFRSGVENITLKNIKFTNFKATAALFGSGWSGTANIIDVEVDAFFTGGKRYAWFAYGSKNLTLNMSDCTFNFTLDANRYDEVVYLFSIAGNGVYIVDNVNTFNISNTTINNPGTIGEHGSNFTFTNCNIKETAKVTYADKYVTTDKTTITIDASKINGASVTGVTSAIVNGTTCTASQDGNTISINSSIYGEKKIKLVTANKIYVFDTIIATHVLTDQATFTSYWTGTTKTNSYAVAANDISIVLTGSDQIKSGWCADFTLNGLGHTIGTFYEYSGLASTNGFKNANFKNMTFKMETFGTIFGPDWLGTINFENVTLECYNKADNQRPLIASGIRGGTVINLTNSTIKITRKSGQQDKNDSLHTISSGHPGNITVNLVNSKIITNGTLGTISSEYKLDANSSISDKNGVKTIG